MLQPISLSSAVAQLNLVRSMKLGAWAAVLVATVIQFTGAAEARDTKELEQICGALVGTELFSPPWQRLAPFLRRADGLRSVQEVCSGSCAGTIFLRDDMELRFSHPNIPAKWPSGRTTAKVDSVKLYQRGHLLIAYPKT